MHSYSIQSTATYVLLFLFTCFLHHLLLLLLLPLAGGFLSPLPCCPFRVSKISLSLITYNALAHRVFPLFLDSILSLLLTSLFGYKPSICGQFGAYHRAAAGLRPDQRTRTNTVEEQTAYRRPDRPGPQSFWKIPSKTIWPPLLFCRHYYRRPQLSLSLKEREREKKRKISLSCLFCSRYFSFTFIPGKSYRFEYIREINV